MFNGQLQVATLIEFRNFKEKIKITKKYFRTAKMEVIDNKYIYVFMREEEQ